jgi:hypothetical protein
MNTGAYLIFFSLSFKIYAHVRHSQHTHTGGANCVVFFPGLAGLYSYSQGLVLIHTNSDRANRQHTVSSIFRLS